MDVASKENSALKMSRAEHQEIEALRRELKKKELQVDAAQYNAESALVQQQKTKKQLDTLRRKLNEVSKMNGSSADRFQQMEKDLSSARSKVEMMESAVEKATRLKQEADTKCKQAVLEAQTLKQKTAKFEEQREKEQRELARLQDSLATCTQALDNERRRKDAARGAAQSTVENQLREALSSKDSELTTLRSESRELLEALRTSEMSYKESTVHLHEEASSALELAAEAELMLEAETAKNAELRVELTAAKEYIGVLKTNSDAPSRDSLDKLISSAGGATDAVLDLKSKIVTVRQERDMLKLENTTLQAKLSDLGQQLSLYEKKSESAAQQGFSSSSKLDQTLTELVKLREAHSDLKQAKNAIALRLQETSAALDRAKSVAKESSTSAVHMENHLSVELKSHQARMSHIEVMHAAKVRALEQQLTDVQEERDVALDMMARLEEESGEDCGQEVTKDLLRYEQAKSQKEALQVELENLTLMLEEEMMSHADTKEQMTKTIARMENAEQAMKSVEKKRAALQKELDHVDRAKQGAAEAHSEVKQLQSQLSETMFKKTQAEEAMQSLQQKKDALEKELRQCKESLVNASNGDTDSVRRLKAELSSTQIKADKSEQLVVINQHKLEKKRVALEKLEKKHETVVTRHKDLCVKYESILKEKRTAEASAESLQQMVDQLLARTEKSGQETQQKIAKLERTLQEVSAERQRLDGELCRISALSETRQRQLESMTAQLGSSRAQESAAQQQVENIKIRAAEEQRTAERQLSLFQTNAKQELNTVMEEQTKMRQQLEAEVNALQEELARARKSAGWLEEDRAQRIAELRHEAEMMAEDAAEWERKAGLASTSEKEIRVQYEDVHSKLQRTRADLSAETDKLEAAIHELNCKEELNKQLSEGHSAAEKKLSSEVEMLRQNATRMESSLKEQLQSTCRDRDAAMQLAEEAQNTAVHTQQSMQKKLERSRQELERISLLMKKEKEELRARLEETQDDLRSTKSDLMAMEGDARAAQSKCNDLEAAVRVAGLELERTRSKHEAERSDLEGSLTRSHERDLANAEEKFQRVVGELQAAQATAEQYKEQCEQLRADIQELNMDIETEMQEGLRHEERAEEMERARDEAANQVASLSEQLTQMEMHHGKQEVAAADAFQRVTSELASVKDQFQIDCEMLNSQVHQLQHELLAAASEIKNSERKAETAETALEKTEGQLEDSRQREATLNSELEDARQEVIRATQELSTLEASFKAQESATKSELEQLARDLEFTTAQRNDARIKVEVLTDELKHEKQELQMIERNCDAMQQSLATTESKLDAAEESAENLGMELEELKVQLETMKYDSSSTEKRVTSELHQARQNLAAAEKTAQALNSQVDLLEAQKAKVEAQLEERTSEVAEGNLTLDAAINEAADMMTRADSLEAQLDQLTQKYSSLEGSSSETIRSLKHELEMRTSDSNSKLRRVELDLTDCQKSLERATQELDHVRSLNSAQEKDLLAQVESLRDSLNKTQHESRTFEREGADLRRTIKSMEAAETGLSRKVRELELELEMLGEEKSALKHKIEKDDHDTLLNKFQAFKKRSSEEAEDASQKMSVLRQQVQELQLASEENQRKEREGQQQLDRAQAELNQLRRQVIHSEATVSTLKDRMLQEQSRLTDMQALTHLEKRAFEDEKLAHERTQAAIAEQQRAIEAAKAREAKLRATMQTQEKEMQQLQRRLSKLDAAGSEVANTLHLQEQVQQLKRECRDANTALKQKTTEMKKRNQMVLEYEEQLTALQNQLNGGTNSRSSSSRLSMLDESNAQAEEYATKYNSLIIVNRGLEKKVKGLEARLKFAMKKIALKK